MQTLKECFELASCSVILLIFLVLNLAPVLILLFR